MKKCILQICAGNPYFNFLFCKFRSKIFHQEHFLNGLINQSLKYGMSPIKLSLLKYYHFNFHQPPLLWYTIYEISVKAHNLFLRPEIQGNLPSASTFLGCERGGSGNDGVRYVHAACHDTQAMGYLSALSRVQCADAMGGGGGVESRARQSWRRGAGQGHVLRWPLTLIWFPSGPGLLGGVVGAPPRPRTGRSVQYKTTSTRWVRRPRFLPQCAPFPGHAGPNNNKPFSCNFSKFIRRKENSSNLYLPLCQANLSVLFSFLILFLHY